MPRARYIKPGFFKNEELAQCDPLARILFSGLWCWADAAGRVEERKDRLKVEILPYDECNVISLLGQLEERGFVRRYTAPNGTKVVQVVKFKEHQRPHKDEPEKLPAAPEGIQPYTLTLTSSLDSDSNSDSGSNTQPQKLVVPAKRVLPCDEPELYSPAKLVVQHYQQAVRPAHSSAGGIEAVLARLRDSDEWSPEKLKQAADRYAAQCFSQKRQAQHRLAARTFFSDPAAIEEAMAWKPEPKASSFPTAEDVRQQLEAERKAKEAERASRKEE